MKNEHELCSEKRSMLSPTQDREAIKRRPKCNDRSVKRVLIATIRPSSLEHHCGTAEWGTLVDLCAQNEHEPCWRQPQRNQSVGDQKRVKTCGKIYTKNCTQKYDTT
jgi:hypothetical protein